MDENRPTEAMKVSKASVWNLPAGENDLVVLRFLVERPSSKVQSGSRLFDIGLTVEQAREFLRLLYQALAQYGET